MAIYKLTWKWISLLYFGDIVNNKPFVLENELGLYTGTLVFQLEGVCGINIVAHKMKNVSGGI